MDIGFVYYWHVHDYRAAADWIQHAAGQPNAPNWLRPLAATMLVHGQDRASARFLWQQIGQSEEDWLRRAAARALLQLDALDQIDRLEPIVMRSPPPPGTEWSWLYLARRGALRGIPIDPVGRAVSSRSRHGPRHRVRHVAAVPDAGHHPAGSAVTPRRDAADAGGPAGARVRQLLQRLHPPHSARPVAQSSRLALPGVRLRAAVVRQHPGTQFRDPGRQVPAVPAAHQRPVSHRGAAHVRHLRAALCSYSA